MAFQSKNMNYIFNVEYFEGINFMGNDEASKKRIAENNKAIRAFAFQGQTPTTEWKKLPGYQEFTLYTTYPGMLIGVGNPHELAIDGAIKCGFSFDYVTGLPFLPGSSLKGILRSFFPSVLVNTDAEEKENRIAYLKGILGDDSVDVAVWEKEIFENNDVFLGAYPEIACNGEPMMEMEFITAHKSRFKDPNPVSIMKVKPNVKFVFSFLLSGDADETKRKIEVFKQLLLDGGVGAKTNVGFGRLSEEKTKEADNKVEQGLKQQNGNGYNGKQNSGNYQKGKFGGTTDSDTGRCKNAGCSNPVTINPNTGKPNRFCSKCYRQQKGN